jgi:hypothetical protein
MEHEACLTPLCQAMLVCSDVAFFEKLHSYQQKRNAEEWRYIQENLSHYTVYSLPDIEFTEKQQRQQTIMAYLSALAMESDGN